MGAVNMVNTTNSSRVGGYIAASGLPFVIRTPWEQSPEIDSDENKTSSCKTYIYLYLIQGKYIKLFEFHLSLIH